MAESSESGKIKVVASLDAKSEKQVRRYLDKRRHVYRERRTGRITKLLYDLMRSEEEYVGTLEKISTVRDALVGVTSADDHQIVFGEVRLCLEAHQQLVNVLLQATSASDLTTDPVAQREFVQQNVMEPLTNVLPVYGSLIAHHFRRQRILQEWAKTLEPIEQRVGSPLARLFSATLKRMEEYKNTVDAMVVLLEEERAPIGSDRRKQDVETSERIQATGAKLMAECARLQVSLKESLNWEHCQLLVSVYQLGDGFMQSNALRLFVREDRVRVASKKGGWDDSAAAILLFSDMVVLAPADKSAKAPRAVQVELASCEVENDDGDVVTAAAPPAGDAAESGASRFLKPRGKKTDGSVSTPAIGIKATMDSVALALASPSFFLVSGGERWQITCSDRAKRVALVEDLLNQKYKHRVFGQSIVFLAERDGDAVPEVIRNCAKDLKRHADEEGIFRIPGRAALIDSVCKAVDSGMRADLSELSPHDVAGVFKSWYRMLPTPIIPKPLIAEFLATNSMADPEQRVAALRELCDTKLPSHNLRVLSFTLGVLAPIAAAAARSKMDADNLAVIFGPVIFFSFNQPEQTKEEILDNAKLGPDIKNCLAFLITHSTQVLDDAAVTLKGRLLEAQGKAQ